MVTSKVFATKYNRQKKKKPTRYSSQAPGPGGWMHTLCSLHNTAELNQKVKMMSATAWTSLKVTMLRGKGYLQRVDPGTPLVVWRFRNRLAVQGTLVPSQVTELTSHKQLQETVHHGARLLSERSKVPRATTKTQCCCCCSVAQLWPTLCDPQPGFPVHHRFPELAQTHAHWVRDAIQPSDALHEPYK